MNAKHHMIAGFTAAAILSFGFIGAGSTSAAPADIRISINNQMIQPSATPYIKGGTTLVPLNMVTSLPGTAVEWNNKTKTVTVKKGTITVLLRAGSSTASVQATASSAVVSLTLPVQAELKQGRIMVPLRFIAAAAGAEVRWNAAARTVEVTSSAFPASTPTPSSGAGNGTAASPAAGSALTQARNAALALKTSSQLPEIASKVPNEGMNVTYYFPQNRSDAFFISASDKLEYYVVENQTAKLTWQARLKLGGTAASTDKTLPMLQYPVDKQNGSKPSLSGPLVYFKLMPHIGEAAFGLLHPDGTTEQLGQQEVKFDAVVVDVPGEGTQR
ncbi:copper amine oxidase N-terminal domain-containing protein [Paenibacillus donghaensis]|uniref:Copper amine oxidase-like N-terminal domain-containing protein n=1 Tax=Paenibacillus donghaensis TaxID=414771 RepID=A0A2Z2KT71_9BACL|nr:copper amine oxidase N-terminal domain-containing protein [Paenibacillus donghaensis]ASA22538.1 hypothetical protein B9T62_18170 [Paenibacillus donghaensis]